MHISLGDLDHQLDEYVKSRPNKTDRSKVVRYALEQLFAVEDLDPVRQSALKLALERRFTIPKNIPLKAFHTFLYLLSKNYSEESSKDFWSEVIYSSSIDKSHAEVYADVKDEFNRIVASKGNETNGSQENSKGEKRIPSKSKSSAKVS